MLLTSKHRRSSRSRVPKKPFDKETFVKSNKVDRSPGKVYIREMAHLKEEVEQAKEVEEIDIYDECPDGKGYEYDKDMYLANDHYAQMVDEEIAQQEEKRRLEAEQLEEDCKDCSYCEEWISRKERFSNHNGNEI